MDAFLEVLDILRCIAPAPKHLFRLNDREDSITCCTDNHPLTHIVMCDYVDAEGIFRVRWGYCPRCGTLFFFTPVVEMEICDYLEEEGTTIIDEPDTLIPDECDGRCYKCPECLIREKKSA